MEELTSVLKNVPLPLMDKIRKYRTRNSIYEVNWKYREPKKGEKYAWGGTLRRDKAKSADMYVSTRKHELGKFAQEREANSKYIDELLHNIELLEDQLNSRNADKDEIESKALIESHKKVELCENIIKQLCLLL